MKRDAILNDKEKEHSMVLLDGIGIGSIVMGGDDL